MSRLNDKQWLWTVALFAATATSGIVRAGEGKTPSMPSAMAGSMVTATAKVEKIDVGKRELTLKTSDTGKDFTIDVPEQVTRLDNVKKGDTLNVSFYQSVAVSLLPPGQGTSDSTQTGIEREPGKLPNGATIQRITTTAKITKIDKDKQELTLENPTGQVNTVSIQDPGLRDQMSKLKVGDRVRATYTQALATSVTPKKTM